MKRIHILILLFLAVLAVGCNIPGNAKNSNQPSGQASDIKVDDMVQTIQAEESVYTEADPGESVQESGSSSLIPADTAETQPNDPKNKQESQPEAEPAAEVYPTADPNRIPPELPAVFHTDELNKLDTPHTYVTDACEMIKNRWGEGKAAPGTIVMAIMYHSIAKSDSNLQDNAITVTQHQQLMRDLHDQGFTAINTEQFIAFMESNEWIPERSVLLIQDDRRREENFETHFKSYYEDWGWPVINAWISADNTSEELWKENERVEAAGYVDHQAHGVVHNIPMGADSTDEYLIGELKGSVDRIEEHFHKTPRAIIWPGGGFGTRAIEIAKEYGYKVGFTTHPRGPVMYNWVPLCDAPDPTRPAYQMDGNQDPLFVIPRYWDTDAAQHVDTVRQMGKQARDYLYSIRETEVEYYDIVCRPTYGDL